MASHLLHNNINLTDLVNNIENGLYCIPKFQRDYVWKASDICSLADSIIRGYPISSFLTIPCNGTLKVGNDRLKTHSSKVNEDISKLHYILDGQQRITSIAKIFLNYDNERAYYFDLFTILKEKFPENTIEIEGGDKFKDTIDFCRFFKIGKDKDEQTTKHNYRYISGKAILDGSSSSIIRKFLKTIKKLDDTQKEYEDYEKYLNVLLSAIPKYDIPITSIPEDADLGLVCRVFEKVNSSGIKLTTFDLINAKSFDYNNQGYSEGIANFITGDLLEYLEKSPHHKKLEKVYIEFLDYEPNTNKFLNLARIIKIIASSEFLSNDKIPLLTNHQMLIKKSDYWFNEWTNNKHKIFKYLEWLAEEDIVSLCSPSYYEFIGGVLLSNEKLFNISSFMTYIKKKAFSLGIQSLTFNNSNMKDVMEIHELGREIVEKVDLGKHTLIPKINILLDDDLSKYNKNTTTYRVALHLMTKEKKGKFTIDLVDQVIKGNDFDEHHIIPKSQAKKKGDIYNSIINITILNKDTNRNEIKNKPMAEYMNKLKEIYGDDKFIRICEQNLIPWDCLDNEEKFLKERNKQLTNYIHEYFK